MLLHLWAFPMVELARIEPYALGVVIQSQTVQVLLWPRGFRAADSRFKGLEQLVKSFHRLLIYWLNVRFGHDFSVSGVSENFYSGL